jgi:aspartyl-tRNA(Asn)/glutamyl-tRNA(Gln) amidotransferase subunit A
MDRTISHHCRPPSSVGAFATTVENVIAFDEVITGRHTPRTCRAPVFIIPSVNGQNTTLDIDDQFASVVAELRSAGAQIVGRRLLSLSAAQALLDTHGTIVGAEAFLLHNRHLGHPLSRPRPDAASPPTRARRPPSSTATPR